MQTPVLVPVAEKKTAEVEQGLLTEIANEANVSDWRDLRWFAVGGNKPRSIVVVRRGKSKQTVTTISKTNNPTAWASWEPVLVELQTERAKTNKHRVSHDKLKTGSIGAGRGKE